MGIAMLIVFVLAIGLFCSRMKWRIATLSLIYYMEQKQYKQPDEKEMKDCPAFVVKHMGKDLTGRGDRKL